MDVDDGFRALLENFVEKTVDKDNGSIVLVGCNPLLASGSMDV
jgi:hypothetical protein